MNNMQNIVNSFLEKKIDSNYGKGFFKISKNWNKIVGSELATQSKPARISFISGGNSGILYIKVKSGSISLNIFYSKKKIIDEIAFFFGYAAIKELKTILE